MNAYEHSQNMDMLGNPLCRYDLVPIFHNESTSNSLTIPTSHDNCTTQIMNYDLLKLLCSLFTFLQNVYPMSDF